MHIPQMLRREPLCTSWSIERIENTPTKAIPVVENIHQRIYAAVQDPRAFCSDAYHGSNGDHCRGGWAIHLGGERGYALEHRLGSYVAAALIFMASDKNLQSIPDFYGGKEETLEDIKAASLQCDLLADIIAVDKEYKTPPRRSRKDCK